MGMIVDTNVFIHFEKSGKAIDLIIAATARYHALSILTDNVEEFSRVPGLPVIPFIS